MARVGPQRHRGEKMFYITLYTDVVTVLGLRILPLTNDKAV